jgi:thermitase
MKYLRCSLLANSALLAVIAAADATIYRPQGTSGVDYKSDELVMKLGRGANGALLDAGIGAKIKRTLGGGWRVVRLPSNVTVDRALEYYGKGDGVLAVQPNWAKKKFYTPNDPLLSQQWMHTNVNSFRGWDLSTGRPSVVVAIIDTGIASAHEEYLGDKLVPGYNFSENNSNTNDDDGHGTHCAGIAAGTGNNGLGIAGIAYSCRLMPVRIFPNAFTDTVVNAVKFVADQGVEVANMSYGSYWYDQAEDESIQYAWQRGVVLVAAAGNDNVSTAQYPSYPANFPNVINVGASTRTNGKAGFSNFGNGVHVAAPGDDILSTVPGGYANYSGTSMAAPVVAGLAALMFSVGPPDLTNAEISRVIKSTAVPIGNWLRHGLVNVPAAMSAVDRGTPIPAELVSTWLFQGSQVSGPGTLINVRSVPMRGLGHMAGYGVTFRLPNHPLSSIRGSSFTSASLHVANTTQQLYLRDWTKTNGWDLVKSNPGRDGSVTIDTGRLTSKYVNANREVQVLSRLIRPIRPGVTQSPFTYSAHSAGFVGNYSLLQ